MKRQGITRREVVAGSGGLLLAVAEMLRSYIELREKDDNTKHLLAGWQALLDHMARECGK